MSSVEDHDGNYRRLMEAVARTDVVRAPKRYLHTFGVTTLRYYVVTEPVYRELVKGPDEAVVREGTVTAQRPAVVTPSYMAHLEGFGEDAYSYFNSLAREQGPNATGLLYQYKNEPGEMSVVEGNAQAVANRISNRVDDEGGNLSAVIMGVDELWDVSLLKFIYEYTLSSLAGNVSDLRREQLLDQDPSLGVPKDAIQSIESLFRQTEEGADPSVLKRELDRWGLFDRYQDRFLGLFHRKGR